MTNASINMDARWLRELATNVSDNGVEATISPDFASGNELHARFIAIADHIDSIEEKLARVTEYELGWIDGRAYQRSKSNILASHEIVPADGKIIEDALAKGLIKKVPRGVSGLPPEPPWAPKKASAKPKPEPKLRVDLTDL